MKKNILSFSFVFLAAMMLVSCKKNSPKDIAHEWLNDFYHLDYEAAKKLSTEDTKNLLSQVEQLSSMIPDSTKKAYKNISITIKSVKVNGDKAMVTYVGSDNPTLEQPLNLVKANGQWLVMYTKEDQPDPSSADIITDPAADSMANSAADTTHH